MNQEIEHRDFRIAKMRIEEGATYREIAKPFGLSWQRVQQIVASHIKRHPRVAATLRRKREQEERRKRKAAAQYDGRPKVRPMVFRIGRRSMTVNEIADALGVPSRAARNRVMRALEKKASISMKDLQLKPRHAPNKGKKRAKYTRQSYVLDGRPSSLGEIAKLRGSSGNCTRIAYKRLIERGYAPTTENVMKDYRGAEKGEVRDWRAVERRNRAEQMLKSGENAFAVACKLGYSLKRARIIEREVVQ